MPNVQEIYDQLIKDPNLEVGSKQTREEAAQAEAQYRVRQYHNNEQALSLATEPLEDDSKIDALKKEKKESNGKYTAKILSHKSHLWVLIYKS